MKAPDYRTPRIGVDSAEHQAKLLGFWKTAPDIKGFLSTTDHKVIGIRYIVTAFVFLGLGGVEALIMRIQLGGPNLSLLTPVQYNQLFSTHGMTMIFLYASPILSGF
jgi:heme/copper-type cytochrome/quinol oxidase subunit 1